MIYFLEKSLKTPSAKKASWSSEGSSTDWIYSHKIGPLVTSPRSSTCYGPDLLFVKIWCQEHPLSANSPPPFQIFRPDISKSRSKIPTGQNDPPKNNVQPMAMATQNSELRSAAMAGALFTPFHHLLFAIIPLPSPVITIRTVRG